MTESVIGVENAPVNRVIELRDAGPTQWERFHAGLVPHVDSSVITSWKRSRDLGAPLDSRHSQAMVETATALREREDRLDRMLYALESTLAPATNSLAEKGYVLLMGDADGVLLRRLGGGAFSEQADRLKLIEGTHWSEGARGTNAIGTALAEQAPTIVRGWAHYGRDNVGLVCYSSLIRDAEGRIIAFLDATSFAKSSDPLAQATVFATAKAIEAQIRAEAWQAALGPRRGTLEAWMDEWTEPALALDARGMIALANRTAVAWLGSDPTGRSVAAVGLDWADVSHAAARGGRLEARLPLPGPASVEWRVESLYGPGGQLTGALLIAAPAPRLIRPSGQVIDFPNSEAFSAILGIDPALRRAKAVAARFAATNLPVLFIAETGTGKELFATAVHRASPRASGPLVALNCGALSGQLLEAELFGYAPGAFTGAHPKGRPGKLETADQGTLFLDEVAEMSAPLQAMLLRVLETGTYYRLGEAVARRVDVRLVCATWRDLPTLVEEGAFRRDLYYRIRGASITLPPLRERTDLRDLALGLLPSVASEVGVGRAVIDEDAWAILEEHHWPGNVRELRTVLAQAAVMGEGHVSAEAVIWALGGPPASAPKVAPPDSAQRREHTQATDLDHAEQQAVAQAMEQAQGNISEAARILGIARSTLYRKLRSH